MVFHIRGIIGTVVSGTHACEDCREGSVSRSQERVALQNSEGEVCRSTIRRVDTKMIWVVVKIMAILGSPS